MAAKDYRAWLRRARRTENPGDETGASAVQAVVLRSPAGFACALCQSQYARFDEARRCLETCSLHYRLREPVHVLASPAGVLYRCCLCARVRVHRDDALRCFERCYRKAHEDLGLPARLADALDSLRGSGTSQGRGPGQGGFGATERGPLFHRSQGLFPGKNTHLIFGAGRLRTAAVEETEAHRARGVKETRDTRDARGKEGERSTGGTDPGAGSPTSSQAAALQGRATPPKAKPPADGRSLAVRTAELLSPDLQGAGLTVEPEPETEPGTLSFDGANAVAGEGTEAAADAAVHAGAVEAGEPAGGPARDKNGNILYRVPHQKPFKRADAKYVCTVCNAKFFSKTEVEACFLAHPLDEMV